MSRSCVCPSWFASQPPKSANGKSVRQTNGSSPHERLAGHAGGGDRLAVPPDEIVAERLEVSPLVGDAPLRDRVADAVGVVLGEVAAVGEGGDVAPVRLFEGAGRGDTVRQRGCVVAAAGVRSQEQRPGLLAQPAAGRRIGGAVGKGVEPPLDRLVLGELEEPARERARQRALPEAAPRGGEREHVGGLVCAAVGVADLGDRGELERPAQAAWGTARRVRRRSRRRSRTPPGSRAARQRAPWARPRRAVRTRPAAGARRPRGRRPASRGSESGSRTCRRRAPVSAPRRSPRGRRPARRGRGGSRRSRAGRCAPSACRTGPWRRGRWRRARAPPCRRGSGCRARSRAAARGPSGGCG